MLPFLVRVLPTVLSSDPVTSSAPVCVFVLVLAVVEVPEFAVVSVPVFAYVSVPVSVIVSLPVLVVVTSPVSATVSVPVFNVVSVPVLVTVSVVLFVTVLVVSVVLFSVPVLLVVVVGTADDELKPKVFSVVVVFGVFTVPEWSTVPTVPVLFVVSDKLLVNVSVRLLVVR